MTIWRLYIMSFLDKIKTKFSVAGYYLSSEKENRTNAESYIDRIIQGNNDIVLKNMSLINYINQHEDYEFYAYLLSGKVQDSAKKRDRAFYSAMGYFNGAIKVEEKAIETAKAELVKYAKIKYDRLGLIEPKVIDVDELIAEGFFFKGDPRKVFDELRKETILSKTEPSVSVMGSYYRYMQAKSERESLMGFRQVAYLAYKYVDFREELLGRMETFYDMPVYRNTLSRMNGVNNGRIFAIDKSLLDTIFEKHDGLWKYDRQVYGTAVVMGDTDNPKAEIAREQVDAHKVFENEVGYLRTRPTITSVANGDNDERKVLCTAHDLTRFIECAYDIKGLKGDAVRLVDYIVHEFETVPQEFADSEIISEFLPKNISISSTDDEVMG